MTGTVEGCVTHEKSSVLCFWGVFFAITWLQKDRHLPSTQDENQEESWHEWSQTGTASRSSQGTAPSSHFLPISIWKLEFLENSRTGSPQSS